MKKYIKPEMKVSVCDSIELFCVSNNLDGSSLGNDFDSKDISYVRENDDFDIWDVNDFFSD